MPQADNPVCDPGRDLLAALAADDNAQIAELYRAAGLEREVRGETDAACFFFSHARVYALKGGCREIADDLFARLCSYGRES